MTTIQRASVDDLRAAFVVLDEIMSDLKISSDVYLHVQQARQVIAVLIVQQEMRS